MSELLDENKMSAYSQFIAISRYARWLEKENRRESWEETVDRYVNYVFSKVELEDNVKSRVREDILGLKTVPSMRALMTAGPALERCNVAGYNCSYLPVDSLRSFDEAFYILMCGTGVGFSVESSSVNKLPEVSEHFENSDTVVVVKDSKAGWARALRELLAMLWAGQIPQWNTDQVRPAGARLKTFGGRASGPEPLENLFKFCVDIITNAAGRRIKPIEAHDIMCKIGEVVVVGGIRRSAMISLSDLNDREMAEAKSGAWYIDNPQRALANNSAVYNGKPNTDVFMEEWTNLYRSKSGERGIVNRAGMKEAIKNTRRDENHEFGLNPCCVVPDTWIMTADGPRQIQDLKGEYFTAIVDGEKHDANHGSWVSGVGDIYALKTKEGYELKLTPEHQIMTSERGWVQAKDLKVDEKIKINNQKEFNTWGRQDEYQEGYNIALCVPQNVNALEKSSSSFTKGFIDGARDTGFQHFSSVDLKSIQRMMLRLGKPSRLEDIIVETNSFVATVESFEFVERGEVWDAEVSDVHAFDANGIYAHNSEIILRPYQFCVTGDTPLITKDGIYDIGEVEGQQVEVWNGEEWSEVTVRKTREDTEVVRVVFSDGTKLDCTPDHKFSVKDRFQKKWSKVEAKDLMGFSKYSLQVEPSEIRPPSSGVNFDDAYTLGFAVGDGHVGNKGNSVYISLYGEKDFKCPVSGRRGPQRLQRGYNVPMRRVTTDCKPEDLKNIRAGGFRQLSTWNSESVLNFFAGLADADGSMTPSGGIRIYISQEENVKDAQLVLSKNGVRSSANLCQKAGSVTNKGLRSKDLWYLQITDASAIPTHRLDTSRGHAARFKGKYQNVVSVEPLDGKQDVYCFNEPKRHMAVFNNVLTYQCNLSEVIVREKDTLESLKDKVEIATILGTIQSSFTNFKYLRKIWKQNTQEEALLGVSLTGQLGHKVLSGQDGEKELTSWLLQLKDHAIQVNKKYAALIGINESAAITTVKPSGTVSQLSNSSSGIHPWWSDYYVRTVRSDNKDPLTEFMKDIGIPNEVDVMNPGHTTVFSFPIKATENALTREDLSAVEHLRLANIYKRYWAEHNISITVNIKEEEWLDVASWVYENFDDTIGVSFLPYSEHTYRQAPYQECTKEEYEDLKSKMPESIDWKGLVFYEKYDQTAGAQTAACSAGSCEIVDISETVSIPESVMS